MFAPTDAAFANVPKAKLAALAKDKAKLSSVLLYHVVKGKATAAKVVKLTTAKTLNGKPLTIRVTRREGLCRRRASRRLPTSPPRTASSTSSTGCSSRSSLEHRAPVPALLSVAPDGRRAVMLLYSYITRSYPAPRQALRRLSIGARRPWIAWEASSSWSTRAEQPCVFASEKARL